MPLSDLTSAERWLVRLCRAVPWEGGAGSAPDEVTPEDLLRQLTGLSTRHAVQGLVFSRLAGASPRGGLGLSPRHLAGMRESLTLLTRQATVWDFEQDRVLGALGKAGFAPLVLKGGALRRWVYRSSVERSMGDLDILVREEEMEGILGSLRGVGYESTHPEAARHAFRSHLYHDRVSHPNGFHVEVHWGLTRPGSPTRLDPQRFHARARALEGPGGRKLKVPSPEDMVLHTVSQSEQDGVQSFRRLVDLDRVVRSEHLDWDYVVGQATEIGLFPALCVALRLANLTLETPAPAGLLQGRGLPWISRKGIASLRPVRRMLRERKRGAVPDHHLFRLWCMPTWGHRRRWITGLASGARDPLEWVWEKREADPGGPSRDFSQGVFLVSKLLAHQGSMLVSDLASSLTAAGRTRLRFWQA